MPLVEMLLVLRWVIDNGEAGGEVDDLLRAQLVNLVVLGLQLGKQVCRVHPTSKRAHHPRRIVLQKLWQDLVEPGILLSLQIQQLRDRRGSLLILPLTLRREVHVNDCVAPIGKLCSVNVFHNEANCGWSLPHGLLEIKVELGEHSIDCLIVRATNEERVVILDVGFDPLSLEAKVQLVYQ